MTEVRTDNSSVQEICQRCKYEVASVKFPVDVVTPSKPVMANHAPTVFTLFKYLSRFHALLRHLHFRFVCVCLFA